MTHDDFYVIMPSNACTDKYPENTNSKYIVSWETPIELNNAQNWKVALTEASFSYIVKTIDKNVGMSYKMVGAREERFICNLVKETFTPPPPPKDKPAPKKRKLTTKVTNYKFTDFSETFPIEGWPFLPNPIAPTIALVKDGTALEVTANKRFVMSSTGESLIAVGSNNYPEPDGLFRGESVQDISHLPEGKTEVAFTYYAKPYGTTTIPLSEKAEFYEDAGKFAFFLRQKFSTVFQDIWYDKKEERVKFKIKHVVKEITFLNGLNIALGFNKAHFESPEIEEKHPDPVSLKTFTGTQKPSMTMGLSHMYVYASVVKPIQVGGVSVPLLKNIWLDSDKARKYTEGDIYHTTIKNPMYVPINTTSINRIEINIRSDSGEFVPFIEGSVTSLTLHFKRDGLSNTF